MTVDLDLVASELKFVDHKRTRGVEILKAISAPPTLTRTIEGSSTLEIPVNDPDRVLLKSEAVRRRSWVVGDGMHFEFTQLRKVGSGYTLVFEDAIAAALRRYDEPMSIPRNSTSRGEIGRRIAHKVRVDIAVDPGHQEKVHTALKLGGKDGSENAWDFLGTDVAEPIHWRRFSDGRRLVLGSDDWLLERDNDPMRIHEHGGPVHDIDFDLSVRKRAATATVYVDARRWSIPPGSVVIAEDVGPANGKWLVSRYTRPITQTRATVELVRKRHELDEPKGPGLDSGDPNFLPGQEGDAGGGLAGNPAREKMLRFAFAQTGKPYVYGASGPDAFDCSGFVQAATRYAGRTLPKPSAAQWSTIVNAGKTISIETALRTRGALLFRIGVSEFNHVAFSLGNGSTLEARGTGYGIGVFGGASSGGWTGAGIWL